MRSSNAAAPARLPGDEPLARVPLGVDELEFGHTGNPQRWPCQVWLNLDPAPVLVFEVTTQTPTIPVDWTATVRLAKAGCSCEVLVKSWSYGAETRLTLTPTTQPLTAGGSQRLTEVQFEVINAPHFFVSKPRGGGVARDQLEAILEPWRIQLEPATTRQEIGAFSSPFYRVTHAGRLKRADGAPFDSGEVSRILDVLHAGLSFAAGRWSAPVLVRGLEADGACAWQEWGTRTLEPHFSSSETWFDKHHGQSLTEVMTGLARRESDAIWKDAIESAMHWYISAIGPAASSDGGLILLEAALERLSAHLLVHYRRSLSEEGFERLAADDRIRLLLDTCSIPVSFPAGLKSLRAKAEEQNWPDAPAALARLRNSLATAGPADEVLLEEAARLAAWYVELALLKFAGYSGEYVNRTRAEHWVEAVPWAH